MLAAALGFTAYSLFNHTQSDYLTVSQAKSQVASLENQTVRVRGNVVPESIDWDAGAKVMRFALSDGRDSLAVVYKGMVPDNFKPLADLVVEGRYGAEDTLEARGFIARRSLCNICHS